MGNKESHNQHSSVDITRTKLRMTCAKHKAYMEEKGNLCKDLVGVPERKGLEWLGVGGSMILE